MNEITITCPKCEYQRQPSDDCPDYECPKCGIVYAKYHAMAQRGGLPLQSHSPAPERHRDNNATMTEPLDALSNNNGLGLLKRIRIVDPNFRTVI